MLDKNAALVVIDMQKGFDEPSWGIRNNPQAESNIEKLLEAWRTRQQPIFHIQHMSIEPESPLRPNQVGNEFKEFAQPHAGEPIIQKNVNAAFIGTDLEAQLRNAGVTTVVFVGLTSEHCVSTTARISANLGFNTYVVEDATASFDRVGHDGKLYRADDIQAISLASLHDEFATIVATKELLS